MPIGNWQFKVQGLEGEPARCYGAIGPKVRNLTDVAHGALMNRDEPRQLSLLRNERHVRGILFVVLAATIWVLASFLVQAVEEKGLSPFLLSYIANSLFIVYLPLDKVLKKAAERRADLARPEQPGQVPPEAERLQPPESRALHDQPKLWGYFERDVFRAALVVAPLWFLAQLTFNASLSLTSVTSNTLLSSTASLFTYGLSWLVLGELFVAHKLVSILACAAGTCVITLADSEDAGGSGSTAGDALCLLSAACYACYTVAIKRMLGGDEDTNTVLFFGYVGLINLVGLAPVLLALQLLGWVDVRSMSAGLFGLVVAKGLLDNALSDYLWARAVLLIGPTVATVGMSIQVPLAVGLDLVWKHPAYAHSVRAVAMMVLGGWFVLVGFVGVNVPPRRKTAEPGRHKSAAEGGSEDGS